ncbi:pyridine nucleotide-disulfide oxidoreductase [Acidihalobacter yilgarnensis]|uniref:Pyridine nucleotide-disulfide oxidoreductase n=1 Tax=Acidihalobacter yilgarnensis TaxID=2819280 RepID=A0A1D8IS77_9GAMM|nr:FAD/NAD(P)-binding oxidoreductase [Acidihalobacter yilgarnensis]AOU99351.1 pyridine nucleotide-disulfide oxidoreductase [Acidihalobacter yilgarnensis]
MKILIVGGGMGGTILANNLARRLKHELKQGKSHITMLSASEQHMYQPGLLYVCVGRMATDELYREQTSLLEPEIEFHVDPVTGFQLDQNEVTTQSGKTYGYDLLVIATGSRAMPESVPGLAENSVNCYTEANAVEMWRQVRDFQGGTVTIAVGVPHKCPMVPLEVTFVLHDYFKERGILDKVKFQYTYPIGRIHSLAPVGEWAKGEFDRMGIQYETLFNMKEIDGANHVVHSEEGTQSHYDLLVAVPPHKGMAVIEENGLGQSGWIPTDRHSLKMEGRDNVYVLGDTTNLPISKAGSTAHFEAEVLAENIAAIIKLGGPVRDYDGKVFCFIEAGSNRATYAMFNYTQPPAPRAPNRAVHWFKMAYNQLYWASARGLL